MGTGNDVKPTRLTWHNILSIPQKYLKDLLSPTKVMEESIGTGRYLVSQNVQLVQN